MLTTSNLLTAFMLGGWIAIAPPAMAADASYGLQGGYLRGSISSGDIRMAGSLPVASQARAFKRKTAQWGQRTAFQNRHSGGSSYANLNQ
ncbi:MAG: hypothetical protein ACAH83_12115 [Alphaproteobacteria bacterium]